MRHTYLLYSSCLTDSTSSQTHCETNFSECGPKLRVRYQDVAVRIILHYSYNITHLFQFCAQRA